MNGVYMWEIDDGSSIVKLKSIIKNRFGKGLEISRLTALVAAEPNSDFFFKEADLIVPIYQDDIYLGTAKVPAAKDIDKEQLNTLAVLIKMTLVPTLYSRFQMLKENNLKAFEKDFNDNVGLIAQRDPGERIPNLEFSPFEGLSSDTDKKPKIISNVLHLNGIDEIVRKVAHQIHEIHGHWAFVPLSDLNLNFSSLDELKKLGAVTIYVKSIKDLNRQQQAALAEYQKNSPNQKGPLVIVGSNNNLKDIAADALILNDLIEALDKVTFEVNKAPMNYKKLQETAELLFFE